MRILLVLTLLALNSGLLSACSQKEEAPVASESSVPAAYSAPIDVPAGAYTLEKYHASLLFSVDHLGFSNYTAQFKSFDAQLQFDPKNLAASTVTASVDPRSLDLNNPPPGFTDTLLGAEFLDAAKFPQMTFKSTQVDALSPTTARMTGDFTMHGITKPVTLEVKFNGGYTGHPMDPNARIGFSAHGTLKRSEFGMAYGIPEAGSKMGVSDEVRIEIEAEFSGPPLASTNGANADASAVK